MRVHITTVKCLKSNSSDSGETYELSQFIGEWARINSTADEFISCPDNPPVLKISQDEIRYPFAYEEGCDQSWQSSQIFRYNFDGKKFSVDAGWNFEILSHSGSEFRWRDGFDGAEETYERIN